MKRLTERQYRRQVSLTMTLYVGAMLMVWPMAREASELWVKVALTLVPAVPMLYVIGLVAYRIASSDELEQRGHLVGLGVAAAVTGSLSMVGGLLTASGAVHVDGSILLWVFVSLMLSYSVTQWWVMTRHYGVSPGCDDSEGMSRYLFGTSFLLAVATAVGWWRGRMDAFTLGMMTGMVSTLFVAAMWMAWRRRRRMAAGSEVEP